MLLIILLSIIALGVSSYFVQKATIKRYERRERLKEGRKQLFESIRNTNKEESRP